MEADDGRRAVDRFQIGIRVLVVAIYAVFLVLALSRGKYVVALVLAPFLAVSVVMLRQRLRTGEPISFLATVVRLLGRRADR